MQVKGPRVCVFSLNVPGTEQVLMHLAHCFVCISVVWLLNIDAAKGKGRFSFVNRSIHGPFVCLDANSHVDAIDSSSQHGIKIV